MKEVKLRVGDARQKDVGKGVARFDKSFMKQIGVASGKLIELVGERRTIAIAQSGYANDRNRDIVRIDGFIRRNARAAINEYVLVRPAQTKKAEKILLAPIGMRLNVDPDFTAFVKNRSMDQGFCEGDVKIIMMLGQAVQFDVVRTKPRNVPVQLTLDTEVSISTEPMSLPKSKAPVDVKYLLRIDWLNNLVTRIKATKTIFSIPSYEVSDTEEQKVIDTAREIADEIWSIVDVEVTFEANGTIVGTLPWAKVDVFGRVSPTYPDIELPPLPPSFTSQRPYGRVVAPMKRCFKIGVKSCPKEIDFTPRCVVVAIPFTDESQDTYKYAIRPALEEAGFKLWKADEQISNIDIMCKICHAIQESGYLLANITTWNANVVFELGLAYGLAKNVILIKHKKAEVPVDLKGLEYIEYSTIDELRRNLLLFLKGAATAE